MITLTIDDPLVEDYFSSQEEIVDTLKYIVDNKIKYFSSSLSKEQTDELINREKIFKNNRNIGLNWEEVKSKYYAD